MKDDIDQVANDEISAVLSRWLPTVVVVGALAGFMALAWYAYHAGTQSMNEGDLMVVEADKTPVKEKPADPGGMQFPNQDKTIFDTFSNKADAPPKVERVLPTPEEPMVQADAQDTGTFVNDKPARDAAPASNKSGDKAEQVIGTAIKSPAMEPATKAVPAEAKANAAVSAQAQAEGYVAPAKASAPKAAPVEAQTIGDAPVASVAEPVKPVAAAKPALAPATGGAQVQLGAYRSEKEAKSDWGVMQKKFPDLGTLTPVVIKADLGDKGIYYRLRASGIAGKAQAKTLCAKLTANGQACILPTAP